MRNPRSIVLALLASASICLCILMLLHSLGIVFSMLSIGPDLCKKLMETHPIIIAWICIPPFGAVFVLLLAGWLSGKSANNEDKSNSRENSPDNQLSWLQIFIAAAGAFFLMTLWKNALPWIYYDVQIFAGNAKIAYLSTNPLPMEFPSIFRMLICNGLAILAILFSRKLAKLLHRAWRTAE